MLNYQRVFSISNYQIASFHMFSQVSSNDIPIFSISKWFPMAPKRPATRSSRWKTTRRAASWPSAGTGRANAQCWRSLTSAVPGTCLGWKSQGEYMNFMFFRTVRIEVNVHEPCNSFNTTQDVARESSAQALQRSGLSNPIQAWIF